MALIWVEGFDHYGSIGDMLQGAWSAADTFVGGYYTEKIVSPGRFGGKCVGNNGGQYHSYLSRSATKALTTAFVGCAVYTNNQPGGQNWVGLQFVYQGTFQFAVQLLPSGMIEVVNHLDPSGQVVLAQTAVNAYTLNTWQYLEIGTVVGNPGTVQIMVNGVQVLNATGLNLVNGTPASSLFDTIQFNLGVGSTAYFDDVYFCDGSVGPGTNPFNTFQGDCRVQTMFPAGPGLLTQWTPVSPVTSPTGSLTGSNTQANNLIILPTPVTIDPVLNVVAPQSPLYLVPEQNGMSITSFTVYANGASSCALIPVIYEWNTVTNSPGVLVAAGNANTAIVSGANTLSFAAPVALIGGNAYVLGFMIGTASFDFSASSTYATGNHNNTYMASYPCTYPTAPDLTGVPGSGISGGFIPMMSWTANMVNYQLVSENSTDGDFTYNASGTVGQTDLYALNNPVATNSTVLAVQLTGCYRKDDANARSVAQVVESGGLTASGAIHTVNASYTYTLDVMPVNPITSSAWTAAVVNAMQIGPNVVT